LKNLSLRAVASDVQAKPTVLVAEKLGEGGLELLRSEADTSCDIRALICMATPLHKT